MSEGKLADVKNLEEVVELKGCGVVTQCYPYPSIRVNPPRVVPASMTSNIIMDLEEKKF